MQKLGYALSSEEHRPMDLVRYAQRAEELGFSFVSLSDHYHPWIDQQGQSTANVAAADSVFGREVEARLSPRWPPGAGRRGRRAPAWRRSRAGASRSMT